MKQFSESLHLGLPKSVFFLFKKKATLQIINTKQKMILIQLYISGSISLLFKNIYELFIG